MTNIDNTLSERGARYGEFKERARIAQSLQDAMRQEAGWEQLAADQKQALSVIADKIARMLNGDPDYRDNWHDIAGYAQLVDARLARDEERKDQPELPLETRLSLRPAVVFSGQTVGIPCDCAYGL